MYVNNFELSKEAKEYAEKLIAEALSSAHLLGKVVSKSDIRISDAGEVIKD